MTVGLTTAFIGPVSQAQVTLTASTVADESEQKITITDNSGMGVIAVTATELGALTEGGTNLISFIAGFGEEATYTVTNNNPADVQFVVAFSSTVSSLVDDVTSYHPLFGQVSQELSFYPRVDDNIAQGTKEYSVVIAWRPASSTSTVTGNTASVTLTGIIRDDDGGFTLDPDPFLGNTLDDIAEGEGTTFTVVLDAQPASDVVLTLTSSTQVSLGTDTLTFTDSDWSTPKTVSVMGIDDDLVGGDEDYTVMVGVDADNSDDAYDGLAAQILSGTVTDNEAAGVFSPDIFAIPLRIAEGESTTFTVVLGAQPASNVILTLTSSDSDVATVNPMTLTFTNSDSDWSTAQTVSISGVENDLIDGARTYAITLAVASGPGSYETFFDQVFSGFTVTDNSAGFTLNPDPTTSTLPEIAEDGSITFTAVLDAQPSSNVVLTLTSSDTDIATVTAELTFTNSDSDWSTPQTATVAGVNNDLIGAQDYTITVAIADDASDDAFDGVVNQELSGTVADNDTAGFTLNPDPTTSTLPEIAEDGSITFTAVLDAQPSSDVVLALTSSDIDIATVTAVLTFTPSDWSTPQTANVAGVNNDLIGAQDYTITVAINDGASDDDFDDVANQELSGTVTDNDTAGFTLNPTSTLPEIAEDGSITFTAVLDAQPSSDVVLTLTSSDTDIATVTAELTFTNSDSDWSTPQTATVAGVNNDLIGVLDYTITVAIADDASDDNFDDVVNQELSGTVSDDDTAGFTLSPTTTLGTISENGGSISFTVALDAEPRSDVVLTLTTTGKVSLSADTLRFTSGNWNMEQAVMVTGVDNGVNDGDLPFMVMVSVVDDDSDDDFDDVVDQGLSGTVSDDDTPGFKLVPSTLAAIDENGGTTTFTVELNVEPIGDVVIDVTASDTAIATVVPAQLTFDAGNWNRVQTGTVTAVDNDTIGDQNYMITFATDNDDSSDEYDRLSSTLSGTVTDDETAGFTLSETTLGPIAEAGGSTSFTVVLDAEPSSNVELTLTTSGKPVSLSAATLTFTSSDWDDIQTVMVEGIGDTIDDDETYSIIVSVVDDNSDNNFDNVANQELSGTVTDDDDAGLTLVPDPSDGLADIIEGDTGNTTTTFTVVLKTQPASGNVVIDLTASNPAIATVNPAKLTFSADGLTGGIWNTPQTGIVTAVNNTMVGEGQNYMITVAVDDANSSNEYDGLSSTLSGTVNEDDAGLIFASSPTFTLADITVNSDVGTTETVKLSIDPTATVVLTLTSSNPTVAVVSPTTLAFTGGSTGNWNMAQTLTVTPGTNVEVGDGLDYTITVAVDAVNSSAKYSSVGNQELSGTVIDDGLSEEQTEIAIASADTFGTAQVATDLISGHLLAPPAAQPQAQLAGITLGSTTKLPVRSDLEKDPWGDDEDNAWQNDIADLIPGTEFTLPLSDTDSSGGHYEIWGAAGYSDLSGDPTSKGEKTEYDGHATGVHIGIGRRYVNGTSFGVSIGSTKVKLDINTGSGDPVKVERDLISIHPYIGWTFQDGLAAWLIAGYGDGDYEQDKEQTDASLLMLGGGVQRSWSVQGNDVAVRLEGVTTESKLDTKGNLKGESSAWQGRVEFEIGRSFATAGGGHVQPYGTFGYRYDGGDLGGSGAGEIGLGLRSQLAASWTIDVKSRFQVTDSDHERRSIQGHVKYDRDTDRRGWLFTFSNSFEYEVEDADTAAEYTRVLVGSVGYGWSRTLLSQRGTLDLHLKASRGDEQEEPVIGFGFTSPLLRLGLDGSEEEVEVYFNYINTSF